jgi:hypothetical protein
VKSGIQPYAQDSERFDRGLAMALDATSRLRVLQAPVGLDTLNSVDPEQPRARRHETPRECDVATPGAGPLPA